MTRLYGAALSPFVRKVAVLLEEKSITYEWIAVRPHDRNPDFQAISPLGKIPAFQDDRIALADSSVISLYLEKTYPEPALYPTDTVQFAQALWFEEFCDGALVPAMSVIYFQKFFNPTYLAKPTDQALLTEAIEVKVPPLLDYLESQLVLNQWIVGQEFSIADIALTVGFLNMQMAGYPLDSKRYPKLTAYIERAYARPSFVKVNAATRAFLATVKAKAAS
ncbi:MAG: glutathione S-transferase family protein [Rickettsiales bacterium]|nr:glutathione S-transferase family protein [Rickettsiales bacterium]